VAQKKAVTALFVLSLFVIAARGTDIANHVIFYHGTATQAAGIVAKGSLLGAD